MILKKSEVKSNVKIGFFKGKVLCVNPTRQELSDILGFENDGDKDEFSYHGTTKAGGDDYVRIKFWLETEGKDKFPVEFMLINKPALNKGGDKKQFVNQTGINQYADSEENLWESFRFYTEKDKEDKTKWVPISPCKLRQAIQGEASLYTFMRAMFGCEGNDWKQAKVNFYYDKKKNADEQNSIFIDTKKLFANPDKYVQDEFGAMIRASKEDSIIGDVVCLATAKVDDDGKTFQKMYGGFMSGYMMKQVNIGITTGAYTGNTFLKKWKESFDKWNYKEPTVLGALQTFDPNTYKPAVNDIIQVDDTPVDDTDF
jgi:hypothetical protein